MAFTIKNYKVKGITLPEAYVKLMDVTATKYNGFHGILGIYASKQTADENMANILTHIAVSCPYQDNVNIWEVMYDKAKNSSELKDYVLTDA